MVTELLNSLRTQRISVPYEIVISDTSTTDAIHSICMSSGLNVQYHRGTEFGAVPNINNAISLAKYDLVKLMCQDDVFVTRDAVMLFVEALRRSKWVISNSLHINARGVKTFRKTARYDHNQFDKNITGMPSVIGWHKCDLRFDARLNTFCDMYFYYQLYELYGQPGHIDKYCIGQRFWSGSLSRNQPGYHDQDRQFLIDNKMIKLPLLSEDRKLLIEMNRAAEGLDQAYANVSAVLDRIRKHLDSY
jgi:glycosyltransferase involved in cell wall biosynthesis